MSSTTSSLARVSLLGSKSSANMLSDTSNATII